MPEERLLALAPTLEGDGLLQVGWAQATIPGKPYAAEVDPAPDLLISIANWFIAKALDRIVILDKTTAGFEPERITTEFIGAVQFLCDLNDVPLTRRGPGCRVVVVPALKARGIKPIETRGLAGTEAQILAWYEINHARILADQAR